MCNLPAERMRTPTTTQPGGGPGSGSRWSEVREGDDSRATAAELGKPGGAYRQWIIQKISFLSDVFIEPCRYLYMTCNLKCRQASTRCPRCPFRSQRVSRCTPNGQFETTARIRLSPVRR